MRIYPSHFPVWSFPAVWIEFRRQTNSNPHKPYSIPTSLANLSCSLLSAERRGKWLGRIDQTSSFGRVSLTFRVLSDFASDSNKQSSVGDLPCLSLQSEDFRQRSCLAFQERWAALFVMRNNVPNRVTINVLNLPPSVLFSYRMPFTSRSLTLASQVALLCLALHGLWKETSLA